MHPGARPVRGRALLVGLLLAAETVLAGPSAATTQDPVCEQSLPAATDGVLTLDRSTMQPGTRGIGILTSFAQWPTGLVGGGSGETFLSCTPWAPDGAAEVMQPWDPALFLFDVPAGTPAGDYPVSVVFLVGPVLPFDQGTLVRLGTTLTVSLDPVPRTGPTAACAIPGDAASTGQVVTSGTVVPGGTLTLGLEPGDGAIGFNEYDTLWTVACLDGEATPVVQNIATGPPVELAVPPDWAPGPHTVRLLGRLDTRPLWWESTVTVTAPAARRPRELPSTGSPAVPFAVLGVVAVLGGLVLVHARAGRRA